VDESAASDAQQILAIERYNAMQPQLNDPIAVARRTTTGEDFGANPKQW
jgi:hypothetical protein